MGPGVRPAMVKFDALVVVAGVVGGGGDSGVWRAGEESIVANRQRTNEIWMDHVRVYFWTRLMLGCSVAMALMRMKLACVNGWQTC